MVDDFGNLARAAAAALVSAMTTDSWEAVKHRFLAAVGHELQINATRTALAARSGADLDRAKSVQEGMWAALLHQVLDEDPGSAPALRALLGGPAAAPGPISASASVFADRGSKATSIGNITGDRNEVYSNVGRVDKRKYRIFLPPLISIGHAARKIAAAHPIVSGVATVAVATGGVYGSLAVAHGHGSPAPVVSTRPSLTHAGGLPPASGASWAQFHGGPARTGYQPDETRIGAGNVGSLKQARTYRTGASPSAPLVANGILYVDTGTLYAFDATGVSNCSPTTCVPLWTAPTADADGLTVADGDVFVTDQEGIQAFSAAGSASCSGTPKVCKPLWTTSISASTGPGFTPGPGSPAVANGVLYVPGYGDGLPPAAGGALVAAFDVAGKTGCSGTPAICVPMWTTMGLPTSVGSSGTPSIANGVLYIAAGSLYAFNAAGSANCSGTPKVCTPLWAGVMPAGPVTSSAPAVADGIVYVGSSSGLQAFDAAGVKNCSAGGNPRTCSPLWTEASPKGGGGTPAVAKGVVYTVSGAGVLSAFSAAGSANCQGAITARTCAPLWASAPAESGYATSSAPAVANGIVYISSGNGGTYGFDAAGSKDCLGSGTAKTCSPLWSAVTGLIGAGSPAIVNGVLFINISGNGTVYAYSL